MPFNTARRQDVKTPKKAAAKVAPSKTAAKAKKPATPVKKAVAVKAKAPVKAPAKAKAAVKPVVKAKAAPVKAKASVKSKSPVKEPAKVKVAADAKANKTVTKKPSAATSAKPLPKAKSKAAARPVPAKAAAQAKTPPKPVKPAAKAVPAKKVAAPSKVLAVKTKSTPAASKAGVAAKPSPAPKAKAVPAPASSKAAAASQAKPMSVTKVEPVAAPVVPAPAATPSDQPVRASRPSARLAQITVPSLPPAVASTAAKSSFLPSAPAPVTVSFTPIKKDAKLANNWKTKKVDELSDAEIIAMSDAEYMNDVQLAYFRRKLVLLKQDILNSAGETTEHLREDTVVVPDPADRATIEEEHALELRTRDRERKLLKKIEQSIIRIDAGDYGFCDETGEAIGVGRLLARPTATLSLEAQQRRELKQKMFGD
jgi:DnaK suppressor protein